MTAENIAATGNRYLANQWPNTGGPPLATSGVAAGAAAATRQGVITTLLVDCSADAPGTGFYNDGTYIHDGGYVEPGILLASADVGDTVVVYANNGTVDVWLPAGDSFGGPNSGTNYYTTSACLVLQKVAANDWRVTSAV
jgi:hypothetical protein